MALTDTNPHCAPRPAATGGGFLGWLVRIMENHPRMRMVERLNALSDEDLARTGLTRQEAVMQVFGDRIYH